MYVCHVLVKMTYLFPYMSYHCRDWESYRCHFHTCTPPNSLVFDIALSVISFYVTKYTEFSCGLYLYLACTGIFSLLSTVQRKLHFPNSLGHGPDYLEQLIQSHIPNYPITNSCSYRNTHGCCGAGKCGALNTSIASTCVGTRYINEFNKIATQMLYDLFFL